MNVTDELLKSIEIMIKSEIKNLNFDCTYTGVISSVNNDGYTIKYNGTDINIKTSAISLYHKGDIVRFCVPCGNKKDAFLVADIL